MKNGTVKFFNEEKGFGFIKEENGQDIFRPYTRNIFDQMLIHQLL